MASSLGFTPDFTIICLPSWVPATTLLLDCVFGSEVYDIVVNITRPTSRRWYQVDLWILPQSWHCCAMFKAWCRHGCGSRVSAPCDWLRCRRCGCRTLHSPQMFAHQLSVYIAFNLAGWSRARCLVPRRGCCAILARGRRRRCCLGDFRRLICRLLCLGLPGLQGLQQKFLLAARYFRM